MPVRRPDVFLAVDLLAGAFFADFFAVFDVFFAVLPVLFVAAPEEPELLRVPEDEPLDDFFAVDPVFLAGFFAEDPDFFAERDDVRPVLQPRRPRP